MRATFWVGIVFCGCTAKLNGQVSVDGKPFTITSCRSGQPTGFAGVDLGDDTGHRLRLVYTPDGQSEAYWFSPENKTAESLGKCGPLALEKQSSTINNVTNVRGRAVLECTSAGHAVKGTIEFENCH
jgi:hypothetical protein